MVCSLLSEWCVATSFYQSSANYVSFSFCETYSTLSLDGAQSRRLLVGPDVGRGRGSTSSRHEKRQQAKRPLSFMCQFVKNQKL
jgi:hypothetical protein